MASGFQLGFSCRDFS